MEDFPNQWSDTPYNVIKNRLNSFINLYNIKEDKDFPMQFNILGFRGMVKIKSKQELIERIKELAQIVEVDLTKIINYEDSTIYKEL